MLHIFDFAREMNMLGVFVRLFTAMICGGCIGVEREFKRRPAGFRTHILICIGAAITTLTSQYLYLVLNMYTDVARLGAQVICGVGFIGAGTIIVTRRQRIKGLTTAAGLWVNAIIGLACGAGYVEGALLAALVVVLAEVVLIHLEKHILGQSDMNIYVEYAQAELLQSITDEIKGHNVRVGGIEVTRTNSETDAGYRFCAVISISSRGKNAIDDTVRVLTTIPGVLTLEEL